LLWWLLLLLVNIHGVQEVSHFVNWCKGSRGRLVW